MNYEILRNIVNAGLCLPFYGIYKPILPSYYWVFYEKRAGLVVENAWTFENVFVSSHDIQFVRNKITTKIMNLAQQKLKQFTKWISNYGSKRLRLK